MIAARMLGLAVVAAAAAGAGVRATDLAVASPSGQSGLARACPQAGDSMPVVRRGRSRLIARYEGLDREPEAADRPPDGVIAQLAGELVTYDPSAVRLVHESSTERIYAIPGRLGMVRISRTCMRALSRLTTWVRGFLLASWRAEQLEELNGRLAICLVAVSVPAEGSVASELGCDAIPSAYPYVVQDVSGALIAFAPADVTSVAVVWRRTVRWLPALGTGFFESAHAYAVPPELPPADLVTLRRAIRGVSVLLPTEVRMYSSTARLLVRLKRPTSLVNALGEQAYYGARSL